MDWKHKFTDGKTSTWLYLKTFLRWLLFSVCTGVCCGVVGTAFHLLLNGAEALRLAHPWLLYCLPAAGCMIIGFYRCWGVKEDRGTNLVILSIRANEHIPANMAPLMFVSTILTHLCGGSVGREGAALQIAGSIGTMLGRLFRLDDNEIKIITMCGMSALFSALFGTPVTAAIFSMEVVSVGIMHYVAFLPCMVSALIASHMAAFCGIEAVQFTLQAIPDTGLLFWLKIVLLAALCALVSIGFILSLHGAGKLYRRFFKNQYLRVTVGALLVIGLTTLCGTGDYNGAGMSIIQRAVAGDASPWAFLLKILFTALTLGAGFKGGEIVPSFFIGACFGCTTGTLLGLDPGFAAAIGLIAMFCSVVNCPITSIILAMELFGLDSIAVFALAVAVSYMLSGRFGLYASQGIVYSKLRNEYINTTAH